MDTVVDTVVDTAVDTAVDTITAVDMDTDMVDTARANGIALAVVSQATPTTLATLATPAPATNVSPPPRPHRTVTARAAGSSHLLPSLSPSPNHARTAART
jgi:hypothetical protein